MRRNDMDQKRRDGPAKTAATLLISAAVAIGSVVSTGPAVAQGLCMPREKIVEMLDTRYAEAPVARGLDSGGRLVEVFSSNDGATWSLLLTAPNGMSCLMAEGQGWSALQGPLAGELS